jgi:site-specific DNA-methyltransferase (adenine-specific)
VRHKKFKSDARQANALSAKILDRVVEMSTFPGDLIVDPFGGSGTTYAVAEAKHRFWLGTEIGSIAPIKERLLSGPIHAHQNTDFVETSPNNPECALDIAAE